MHNGWEVPVAIPALRHTPAAPLQRRGPSRGVDIDFSTPAIASPSAYAVSYRYDRKRNEYLRFVGGSPCLDANTGRQVAPSNVVVLYTDISPISGDPEGRVQVRTTGAGQAIYLRDGHVEHGIWIKRSLLDPLRFRDHRGRPYAFAPGSTWIDVTAPGDAHVEP
jgi:hypothetical protein